MQVTRGTDPVDAFPAGNETYLSRAEALVRARADLFAVNLVRVRRAKTHETSRRARRGRPARAASTQLRLPLPPRLC